MTGPSEDYASESIILFFFLYFIFFNNQFLALSLFQRMAMQESLVKMMRICPLFPQFDVPTNYTFPNNKPRSSDQYVGNPRTPSTTSNSIKKSSTKSSKKSSKKQSESTARPPPTEKESIPFNQGFNKFNFNLVKYNEPDSKYHLIRWEFNSHFVDDKLRELFGGNQNVYDTFIEETLPILQKLRNVYYRSYQESNGPVNEKKEFQTVFQTFLIGIFQNLKDIRDDIKFTSVNANGTKLDAVVELDPQDPSVVLEDSGYADLFILNGDIESAIDHNINTVVELKPPFGKLMHTSNRAGLFQQIGEIEGVSQLYLPEPAPTIIKGTLTDLNSISLHVRVIHEDKIYHCVSHRIVMVREYLKQLLMICCCPISIDDLLSSITSHDTNGLDREVNDGSIGDNEGDERDDNGEGKYAGGNGDNEDNDEDERDDGKPNGDKDDQSKNDNYKGRNQCQHGHKRPIFTVNDEDYHDYYDDEREEEIQFLAQHDARIRGIRMICTSDFLSR